MPKTPSKTNPPPLGVDISTAAKICGISRAQFYRLYLTSGRIRAIKTGGRDRLIDYAELMAAYSVLRDELPRVEATLLRGEPS